ncbi:MAG: PEP-CTERM sorting domain-containing protein [Pirellulales bacterium]
MIRNSSSRLPLGPKRILVTTAAVVAMLVCTVPVSAALVVNDRWRDGTDTDPASPTYSENGTDADADGDLESVWYQGGGGSLDPAGSGGPLQMIMDGGPTGTSSSSWTTYFTPEASPVALANAGERIRVTWVFTTHDVNATNASQNFRIALVDSPGASRISANGTPGNAAYAGYAIFGNMGETLGHADPFELMERTAPNTSSALLSASGSWEDDFLAADDGTNGNPGYSDNTTYRYVMELTRNALNQLVVSATMTGGNLDGVGSLSVSATDTSPQTFIYDTFALRPSSAATTTDQFDTHLFRVEFIIPEPASIMLLGLSGLALAMMRRRGS